MHGQPWTVCVHVHANKQNSNQGGTIRKADKQANTQNITNIIWILSAELIFRRIIHASSLFLEASWCSNTIDLLVSGLLQKMEITKRFYSFVFSRESNFTVIANIFWSSKLNYLSLWTKMDCFSKLLDSRKFISWWLFEHNVVRAPFEQCSVPIQIKLAFEIFICTPKIF